MNWLLLLSIIPLSALPLERAKAPGPGTIRFIDAGHRSCASIVPLRQTNGPRSLVWCRPTFPAVRAAGRAILTELYGGIGAFIARGKRFTFEKRKREGRDFAAIFGIGVGIPRDDD